MIAGNDGDAFRRPELPEPGGRLTKFLREPDMREIAGHGDVIETFGVEVGAERIQHVEPVLAAPPHAPRKVAEDPLAEQRARAHAFERGQVQIRQVRQHELVIRRYVARHVRRHIGRRGRVRKGALVSVDRELHGTHAVSI